MFFNLDAIVAEYERRAFRQDVIYVALACAGVTLPTLAYAAFALLPGFTGLAG